MPIGWFYTMELLYSLTNIRLLCSQHQCEKSDFSYHFVFSNSFDQFYCFSLQKNIFSTQNNCPQKHRASHSFSRFADWFYVSCSIVDSSTIQLGCSFNLSSAGERDKFNRFLPWNELWNNLCISSIAFST